MRRQARTIAGLATVSAICGAVAFAGGTGVAAAKPQAARGTSFAAETAKGGVLVTISKDGRQVRHALFANQFKCSDGTSFYDFDAYTKIPISAARKFSSSFEDPPEPIASQPGATISYKQSISGTLNKARTRIVGTARSSYAVVNPAGTSYTCDTGTINFIARD